MTDQEITEIITGPLANGWRRAKVMWTSECPGWQVIATSYSYGKILVVDRQKLPQVSLPAYVLGFMGKPNE